MAGVLDAAGITYGLMGGLAVRYLGGDRATRHVDIAFQAPGSMKQLREAVEVEPRFIVPSTKKVSGIMRIFVHIGPGYDDCDESILVEVDLVQSLRGSPRELAGNLMSLTVHTRSGPRQINGVSLIYLLRGKMAAFSGREKGQDLDDVRSLITGYSQETRVGIGRLNPMDVEVFLEKVPPQSQARWRTFFGCS
ncbi:hypothetical protein BJX99DRAFT_260593 [Aspergillus californicus]